MAARSIGEILPGILERCEMMMGTQYALSTMLDDVERKTAIMGWRELGLITEEDASLLITAHMLEDV